MGGRPEHLTQPVRTVPPAPPLSLQLERGEERGYEGEASPLLIPPAGEYGWERTTEREEQGMCPKELIRLTAERDPSWNTRERKTNLEKEKHI